MMLSTHPHCFPDLWLVLRLSRWVVLITSLIGWSLTSWSSSDGPDTSVSVLVSPILQLAITIPLPSSLMLGVSSRHSVGLLDTGGGYGMSSSSVEMCWLVSLITVPNYLCAIALALSPSICAPCGTSSATSTAPQPLALLLHPHYQPLHPQLHAQHILLVWLGWSHLLAWSGCL